MSQSLADFHFLRPWFLLALPLAGLCYWWLKQQLPSQHAWLKVIDKNLLPHLVRQQQTKASKPYFLLIIPLLWIIACIAAAGPSWQKIQQPISQQQQALVIVLDLSLSMYAEDESPSRLVRAKRKIEDILQQRKEGLTALIVYSGDAHLVVPLTDDNNTIINLLPALEPNMMPSFGSNIRAALALAQQQISHAKIQDAQILLLSDELSPDAFEQAIKQLEQSKQLAIITYGSAAGAPIPLPQSGFLKNDNGEIVLAKLNTSSIHNIAQSAGVSVQHNRLDNKDIQAYVDVKGQLQQHGEQRYKTLWQDGGHYLMLPLLLLFLCNFRRGWLLVLMLMVLPEPSYALSWKDLWQNNNQQGQAALEQKDYAQAAEKFDHSAWKSYSHYRAGDFEQAAKQVDETNATSLYNQGNAYAQLGQYPQALDSYEKALTLDKNFADAKANKALIEQLLEKQKEQEKQQDTNGEENKETPSPSDQPQQDQQQQSSDSDQQDTGDNPQQQASDDQAADGQNASDNKQQDQQQTPDDSEQEEQEKTPAQSQQDKQANDERAAEEEEDAKMGAIDATQSPLTREEQQELEQWLRSVPDDPGQLLRNKFRYQYQQNRQRQQHIDQGSEHLW